MSRTTVAALLTSGRTLQQGRGLELGKLSDEYLHEVAVCEMDSTMLRVLEISEGDYIRVASEYGSIVVKSRRDRNGEPGIVFIPCGPYANAITGTRTDASGMPSYKGISVEISPADETEFLNITKLLKQSTGGL